MSHSHSQVRMNSPFVLGCGYETYITGNDVTRPHTVECKSAENFSHPVIVKKISRFCLSNHWAIITFFFTNIRDRFSKTLVIVHHIQSPDKIHSLYLRLISL